QVERRGQHLTSGGQQPKMLFPRRSLTIERTGGAAAANGSHRPPPPPRTRLMLGARDTGCRRKGSSSFPVPSALSVSASRPHCATIPAALSGGPGFLRVALYFSTQGSRLVGRDLGAYPYPHRRRSPDRT